MEPAVAATPAALVPPARAQRCRPRWPPARQLAIPASYQHRAWRGFFQANASTDQEAGGREQGGQTSGEEAGNGQGGDGQQGNDGGAGGEGIESPLPYPLNPTVPISADCSCPDEGSVCNAADVCVPRCEPGGVCAVWRVERSVPSMLTSEDTLYFIQAAQHDDLGNPLPGEAGQESLWKVHYPEPIPTKVAMLEGRVSWLLAHFGDKTYLGTYYDSTLAVLAVDDDGTTVEHALPDDVADFSVSPDGVFALAQDGAISRLLLEPDGSFGTTFDEVVSGGGDVEFDAVYLFASDRLWRQYAGTLCSFELADLQAAPNCRDAYNEAILGAVGGRAVSHSAAHEGWDEVDVDNQATRLLWKPDGLQTLRGTMTPGFVTGWFVDFANLGSTILGRFPTDGIAQNPEPLISQQVVRALLDAGQDGNQFLPPTATSNAVYWTQWVDDDRGPGVSRYIFRAPLPE